MSSPIFTSTRLLWIAGLAATSGVLACGALLSIDDNPTVTTGPVNEAGPDTIINPNCTNPAGFDDAGCWKCPPTNNEELLNACTETKYEPFDNFARINAFDGSLRALPPVEAGVADAGSDVVTPPSDAGSDADAGPPASPSCLSLGLPNPVFIVGATGYPYGKIAEVLGTDMTIISREVSSCLGDDAIITGNTKMEGEVKYYKPDGTENKCSVSPARLADIGVSGLFPTTCTSPVFQPELPADVIDYLGPVTPVMFVAPTTSDQKAISAEAAYNIYGFGSDSGVMPWVENEFIYRRSPSSANQSSTALTIRLPVDRWKGVDSTSSSNMKNVIQNSAQPIKTIGISSSDQVDISRDVMRTLAYKHFKQNAAFYPDSDVGAFDKRNVRDGHYFMWLPLHVLAHQSAGDIVGASGNSDISRPKDTVKNLVFYLTNRAPYPRRSFDVIAAQKVKGLVPQCAMRVTRGKDAADLAPFKPPASCGCAFELASPSSNVPECTACVKDADCPVAGRGTCSFGYCEPSN